LQPHCAQSEIIVLFVTVVVRRATCYLCKSELCSVGVEQLVLQDAFVARFFNRTLDLLRTVLSSNRHQRIVLIIALDINVKRSNFLNLDKILKLGIFVQNACVRKLTLLESFIIKGVRKLRIGLVAFSKTELEVAGVVNVDQHVDGLFFVQWEGEFVIEGQEDDFLVVDAQRDLLLRR
jgi:hypothetical protein